MIIDNLLEQIINGESPYDLVEAILEKSKLDAYDIRKGMEHGKTLARANNVGTAMKRFDSVNGILSFVSSDHRTGSGRNHIQYVQFLDWKKAIPAGLRRKRFSWKDAMEKVPGLKELGVEMHCDCEAFQFWGSHYTLDQLYSAIYPEGRFPHIRDPELERILCKHLTSALDLLLYQFDKIKEPTEEPEEPEKKKYHMPDIEDEPVKKKKYGSPSVKDEPEVKPGKPKKKYGSPGVTDEPA